MLNGQWMHMTGLSFSRWMGIIIKEFIQLKRDRLTFGMIIGIPVMQLLLFGFAINADPKNLPAAVLSTDNSPYARSFIRAMENSGYFRMVRQITSEGAPGFALACAIACPSAATSCPSTGPTTCQP